MDLPDFLFLCFPIRSATRDEGAAQVQVQRWPQWLNGLWQRCCQVLAANQEPRVWQEMNRQGTVIAWHVYDPISGHRSCFGTELEVRLWLEQQYNG